MSPLTFTNSYTRQKETFRPLNPPHVGLYVCGITPYDDSHIGHARAIVVFDTLFRLLREVYGAPHVTFVRNFTDIDDKIIQRAAETNQSPTQVAEHFIASFHADVAALNCLAPTAEPRVSTSLPAIVQLVDDLLAHGFAYVTPVGDVMYRTAKFPSFGYLARRKLSEQISGARVAVDAAKESEHDFVLWKANANSATKLEQAFLPDAIRGRPGAFSAPGRPGWHIECSAMSREILGPVFDLHGGGEDLQFPHHCCEIAQSEALLAPGQRMAQMWLHNGFITVGGTKMSKSLGNFTLIKDALRLYAPAAIRLWLLQTHYRKPVDYTAAALEACEKPARRIHEALANLPNGAPEAAFQAQVMAALGDDLNTAKALALLNGAIKSGQGANVHWLAGLLGLARA